MRRDRGNSREREASAAGHGGLHRRISQRWRRGSTQRRTSDTKGDTQRRTLAHKHGHTRARIVGSCSTRGHACIFTRGQNATPSILGFTHVRNAITTAALHHCAVCSVRGRRKRREKGGVGSVETVVKRKLSGQSECVPVAEQRQRRGEGKKEMHAASSEAERRCYTWKLCGQVKLRRLLFTIRREHTKFSRREHTKFIRRDRTHRHRSIRGRP